MRQDNYLTIISPLDGNVSRDYKFYLHDITGEEGICRDFSFQLNVSSVERLTQDDLDTLIGTKLTVKIGYNELMDTGKDRFINGLVFSVSEKAVQRTMQQSEVWNYEIEIGSWLRSLEYVKDCRIIQKAGNRSTEIVKMLLTELQISDYRLELQNEPPRLDYSTMYNESLSNYIRRLLYEDGIIWFFEHSEGKHTLVIADDSRELADFPQGDIADKDSITGFSKAGTHDPINSYITGSYFWENQPVRHILKETGSEKGKLNHYYYNCNFESKEKGEVKVAKDVVIGQSENNTYIGESTIRSLDIGRKLTLKSKDLTDLADKKYLIYRLRIKANADFNTNTFCAVPATERFIPDQTANIETPLIKGPQTAFAIGQEEQDTLAVDELGRVQVRFHWNRHLAEDSNQVSAWVRVAMPIAGFDRGFLFNIRESEEVVVCFEDGNPDKPYITGSLYSSTNPPPFQPSSEPFMSIIKTSPDADSNQVMFNDKPGSELVEIIAKKEMTLTVNNRMNVDVVKDTKIDCKNTYIMADEDITIEAGEGITNLALAAIVNVAGENLNNNAGSNILNTAAGIVMQGAGGELSSKAGALMAYVSKGISHKSNREIVNESKLAMINKGESIARNGKEKVELKANLAILNKTKKDEVNQGEKKVEKGILTSDSQAETFAVKAKTNIGP